MYDTLTYDARKPKSDAFSEVFLENALWNGESRITVRPVVFAIK